jgi:hypothetical protein
MLNCKNPLDALSKKNNISYKWSKIPYILEKERNKSSFL